MSLTFHCTISDLCQRCLILLQLLSQHIGASWVSTNRRATIVWLRPLIIYAMHYQNSDQWNIWFKLNTFSQAELTLAAQPQYYTEGRSEKRWRSKGKKLKTLSKKKLSFQKLLRYADSYVIQCYSKYSKSTATSLFKLLYKDSPSKNLINTLVIWLLKKSQGECSNDFKWPRNIGHSQIFGY